MWKKRYENTKATNNETIKKHSQIYRTYKYDFFCYLLNNKFNNLKNSCCVLSEMRHHLNILDSKNITSFFKYVNSLQYTKN